MPTVLEFHLRAFDDSFSHKWESLDVLLKDVTEEMAAWQPPGYAREDIVDDEPLAGTILWHVAHLIHCFYHYAEIIEARSRREVQTPPPPERTMRELLPKLASARAELRAQIHALRDEDLRIELRPGLTIDEFVRSLTRHNAWHGGQIAVVKRMYRSMGTMALDHVQLAMPIGEESKARDFYIGILGMTEVPKPAPLAARGGVWFQSGSANVHLGVEADFRPARKAHPGIIVPDYEALLQRCREAGCEIVPAESLEGARRVHLFDCFGNRVEIIARHR